MFEVKRDYPCALAAGPAHGDLGLKTAIAWTIAKTKELGGQPLVYAPGKSIIRDVPLLDAFSKVNGIAVRTWRERYSPWSGGVVLAAWPGRVQLGEIADATGVRGLVVVPWAEGEVDAWVAATNPERLTSSAAATPDLTTSLDPS